jgi:hypothetical protein
MMQETVMQLGWVSGTRNCEVVTVCGIDIIVSTLSPISLFLLFVTVAVLLTFQHLTSVINLLGDGFTRSQTHTHTHKMSHKMFQVRTINHSLIYQWKQNMMSVYLNICGVCWRLGCFNKHLTVIRNLLNKTAAAVHLQYLWTQRILFKCIPKQRKTASSNFCNPSSHQPKYVLAKFWLCGL